MGIGESLKLSAFYISIALAFGAWVWVEKGAELGMQYVTGFFIEKALSIDNIFVISLIFTFFAIPAKYQYRALLWGDRFHYLKHALAAVLVFIGSKIFVSDFLLGDAKFPPVASLAVTFGLIATGIAWSLWKTREGAAHR